MPMSAAEALAAGAQLRFIPVEPNARPENVCSFSSDGSYVLSGGEDRQARLFNPRRRDPLRSDAPLLIKTYDGGHGYGIADAAIAPDNARFATCGGDKAAFYWDVARGVVLRRLRGHNEKLHSVAFGADGGVLCTGSADCTVRLFDLRAAGAVPIQILDEATDAVMSVLVSGSDVVAAGMDGVVRVYDVRKGECYADDLGEGVTGLAVTKDHECVLAMSLDDAVRLLDKSSGRQLNGYYGHGHRNFPMRGDLTYNDAHVVMGSEDGSVLVYDFLTTEVVQRWSGAHRGCATCVRASPTDFLVASTGHDGCLQVFGPPER